jgi:hypothetical protein
LSASWTGDAVEALPDDDGEDVALVHADVPSETDATTMNTHESLFIRSSC